MTFKKRALALFSAALLLLAGCGGGEDGGDGDARPPDTAKVSDAYFGLAHYTNGRLNPVTDNTRVNRLLCDALYEGLFEVSSSFTAEPLLCESYTGDGTTFVFTLREGVKFWSGAPLTADDVVSSLQTAKNTESSPYYTRMTQVDSISTVGSNQVQIVLGDNNVNFPRLLDIPIYRENGQDESFVDGTGPFTPVKENGKWLLLANANWHGGYLGSIRRISLVSMTRADAALSSFQTGDVSMLREPRISANATVISGSVDTLQTPSTNLHYLGFNFSREPLQKADVRRALSAALGRQTLCDTQLQTFASPAVLPVNPQPDSDELPLDFSVNTEQATQLLAGAELETPLSLNFLVCEDNAFKVAAAEQIASAWTAIGVTVNVQKLGAEAFAAALQGGDFDVYYGETRLTADFDLRPLLSGGGALNFGGYASEEMSAALRAVRAGEDLTTFYKTFLEQMPLIPVAFARDQLIVRKGLVNNFNPAPYNAFADVEHWESE